MTITKDINKINNFLAYHTYRDNHHYDVILVLGSATPIVAIKAYELFLNHQADHFMIAGGIGHTTDILLKHVNQILNDDLSHKSEAFILKKLIQEVFYDYHPILLEEKSTHCGENIQNAIHLLEEKKISHHSILLCHDPLMQRRIDATARKYAPDLEFDNFCAFIPKVKVENYNIFYENQLWGLWPKDRYISLLLGEMKRLIDNQDGYGPQGRGFIEHIDIDEDIVKSYQRLLEIYGFYLRK